MSNQIITIPTGEQISQWSYITIPPNTPVPPPSNNALGWPTVPRSPSDGVYTPTPTEAAGGIDVNANPLLLPDRFIDPTNLDFVLSSALASANQPSYFGVLLVAGVALILFAGLKK